jgi:hypothetical protein
MGRVMALIMVCLFAAALTCCGDSDKATSVKENFEKTARNLKDQVEKKASEAKVGADRVMKEQADKKLKGYNKGPEEGDEKEEKN